MGEASGAAVCVKTSFSLTLRFFRNIKATLTETRPQSATANFIHSLLQMSRAGWASGMLQPLPGRLPSNCILPIWRRRRRRKGGGQGDIEENGRKIQLLRTNRRAGGRMAVGGAPRLPPPITRQRPRWRPRPPTGTKAGR